MHSDPDIELFLRESGAYMDINALGKDWEQHFVQAMRNLRFEEMKASFRRGFAKSILGGLTPREYEIRTGWDFDTPEEFLAHLMTYWSLFYPDERPEDCVHP
jgi:hypothetical protein